MLRLILLLLVALLLLGWGGLVVSGSGIIIGSEKVAVIGEDPDSLTCRYFTGTSIAERSYFYSADGSLGLTRCPRRLQS